MIGMQDLFPDGTAVDKERLRQGLVGPILNVQGFGALADGSTDLSEAFDRALSAASPGAVIYLPPGNYALRRPIAVHRTGVRLAMAGASIDATELAGMALEGVHHGYPVTPAFYITATGVDLVGGHLKTEHSSASVTAGILFDGARSCSVNGVKVSGGFYASIWPGGGTEDLLIDSCIVENAAQNIILGFMSPKGPQVTRVTVRDVTSSGSGENGLLAHGHVHDLQIIGGFYRRNKKDGIDLFTCAQDVTIQGVHCVDNGVKGLDFKYEKGFTGEVGKGLGFVGRVTISNCHLHDNGHAGCSVCISSTDDYPEIGISHFIVNANQAHRNGDHGFYFVLREGIVSNNIANLNGDRGFNFLSCRDVIVSANQAIDNCQAQTKSAEAFGFNFESNGKNAPPNRRLAILGNIARRTDQATGSQGEGFELHFRRIVDSSFVGNISSGHRRNVVIVGELENVMLSGNIGI